jgi:hypothetical protein
MLFQLACNSPNFQIFVAKSANYHGWYFRRVKTIEKKTKFQLVIGIEDKYSKFEK